MRHFAPIETAIPRPCRAKCRTTAPLVVRWQRLNGVRVVAEAVTLAATALALERVHRRWALSEAGVSTSTEAGAQR